MQQPGSARLTPEQMRGAIPKVKELIAELLAIDVSATKERGEERFEILEDKVNTTLAEIFGSETVEYDRFRIETLDTAKIHMMYEIPLYEVKKGYARGIEQAVSNLRAVIELFGETVLESSGSRESRAASAFAGRGLDPVIMQAAEELFVQRRYDQAVAKACDALENQVREKSGGPGLCGSELMNRVFNPGDPALPWNDVYTDAGGEEQQGMLFLFAGAMMVGGSPAARAWIDSDPERALDFLSFLSFLAKSINYGPMDPLKYR